MAESLICEIVTPVSTVFSSEATMVVLPGEIGSFGVMQRHEPLVSALKAGVVRVTTAAEGKASKQSFVVSGGHAQINDDKVIVLVNDAVDVAAIDVAAIKAQFEKVQKAIADLKEGDANLAYYKGQEAWLNLQLKTVNAAE